MAKQVITIVIEDGIVQKSDKSINNELPDFSIGRRRAAFCGLQTTRKGNSIFSFILITQMMMVHFRFWLLKVCQLFSRWRSSRSPRL